MSLQKPSNCLHIIKLLNIQENETIPHRFLLVKGKVEGQGRKCCGDKKIALFLGNTPQTQVSADSDSGRFKFLLDLGEEDKRYHLRLKYCNNKLELFINYKQKRSVYSIQPLIILAKDETEEADDEKVSEYQQIIDLNLFLVQAVYAEKLNEQSKGRLCFNFKDKCGIFRSCLTKSEIWQLNEHDLWSSLAKELLLSEWGKDESTVKFVAFIACSKYLGDEVVKSQDFSYENIRKHMLGHVACGTGGFALFSSSYFYSWPKEFERILQSFNDRKKIDLSKDPDDSNYRKTYGGVYASSLGAVCHEIGHIFDLGHDLEGVMGSNFDYINNVLVTNKTTEHLPTRMVVQQNYNGGNQMPKQRFTQIKKTPAQGFLISYREQKENDSFYFSPNSAIILSHHLWLKCDMEIVNNQDFEVDLCEKDLVVKSLKFPLKLIEIRTNSNSLVKQWFELQKLPHETEVFQYNLSKFRNQLEHDCHLFVMSIKGHMKKIWL
ncbi:uncharacterized protein [Musca autumnalis]|uniref:uncharacterized protein n=1 Tax=Musca autumnalis TaxID=221902 RepID=UPI003CEF0746